ncbi:MAG: hypothetical protein ABIH92_01665, partial [Nanoarchaeota archaeon]
MANTSNIYPGTDYGLDPNFSSEYALGISEGYRPTAGQFSFTADPRLDTVTAVSKKLATGAKNIEVGAISAEKFESIPEQHLKEVERLKKLVGVDLTFHAPVIDPTGAKQGWSEIDRENVERQMWSALSRAHKMDPKGNLVATFHSSASLPETETVVVNEETGKEEVKSFWVVDEKGGQFKPIPIKPDYFKGTEGEYDSVEKQKKAIIEKINEQNKEDWYKKL